MKRLWNVLGGLLGLLALGALVAALALFFGVRQRAPEMAAGLFQSPVQTPTLAPHPPPQTPTLHPYPPPLTPTPLPSPSPTLPPVPTLPPGGWRAEDIRIVREVELISSPSGFGLPDWSPDGTHLAVPVGTEQPGEAFGYAFMTDIWIFDTESGEGFLLAENARYPRWSPDGQTLAITRLVAPSRGQIELIDLTTRAAQPVAESELKPPFWLAADRLGFVHNGRLMSVPARGGPPIEASPVDLAGQWSAEVEMQLSPAGQRLAIWRKGQLVVGHLSDVATARINDDPVSRPWDFAWTLDGSRLAYVTQSKQPWTALWIWNTRTQHSFQIVSENWPYFFKTPTWSPDGHVIAFGRFSAGTRSGYRDEIFLVNADGTGMRNLTQNDIGDHYAIWSPDGSKMVVLRSYQDEKDLDISRVGIWVFFLEH